MYEIIVVILELDWSRLVGALIAFGEEAKSVNLTYEVEHAGPPSKTKPHNQDPAHHKYVHTVHSRPPSQE